MIEDGVKALKYFSDQGLEPIVLLFLVQALLVAS